MEAFGYDLVVLDEDAAYLGVGGGQGYGGCGKVQGSLHEELVLWLRRHAFEDSFLSSFRGTPRRYLGHKPNDCNEIANTCPAKIVQSKGLRLKSSNQRSYGLYPTF